MNLCTDLTNWRHLRHGPDWKYRTVGFVPTMGALHAGHEALLARARMENERVVLSIFVNPPQFNDPSDLAKYPRTLDADLELAKPYVDAVIAPPVDAIYADGYRYQVSENQLSTRWEGLQRPGHFEGVLTVVLKLLNIVQPQRAYFGEKDWQQLQLVRGMVASFFMPVEIIGCPTVRDEDGLALSSRNRRLSPAARARAAEFPRILRRAPDTASAIDQLRAAGFEVDYVDDANGERLGAIRIEGVRLIDHVTLGSRDSKSVGPALAAGPQT
jgi:pantoate--beta-alanine ligase